MTPHWIEQEMTYDGRQLQSHFAYKYFGITDNSIVAFAGPVKVDLTEMVDIEDVRNSDPIASDRMVSFIVESFDLDLFGAVWMQRLLMAIIQDEINSEAQAYLIRRDGDDLFYEDRKLSVSIATKSPVSSLIHCALNILPTGAPVPISCLSEIGVDAVSLAKRVMERFSAEYRSIRFASVKVNWVK